MITLVIFILILSLLVLVHEIGHFFVAKKSGVFVEEFGLGIPPRLFGKKIGETTYSLNLLPFGGFVRLLGEDMDEADPNLKTNPRSFLSKSPLTRGLILFAGVFMNFVLALCLYYVLFLFTNFKSLSLPIFYDYKFKYGEVSTLSTVVAGFSPNSPSEVAGIELGEAIIQIGESKVYNLTDIRNAVADIPNTPVKVLLKDLRINSREQYRELLVTTTANDQGKGFLGVMITDSATIFYKSKLLAPFQHASNMIMYTGSTFKEFFKIAFKTKSVEPVSSGVSGPVGIYSIVGIILSYGGKETLLALIDFVALLSLSLALMNVLPLPALDGGRLFFILYELIARKPLNQKLEGNIHKWGLLFFLTLLVLVTIKDIRTFFPF